MDQAKASELAQNLQDKYLELKERVEAIDENGLGMSMKESIGELSYIDNHPADVATDVFERSKDIAIKDSLEIEMENYEKALARVADGTYGYCTQCGKYIGDERLAAMPEAELCIDCKKDAYVPDRHVRPIEEDVIVPPWGNGHDSSETELGDAEDEIMFDGEDSWQAVGRYGAADFVPQNVDYDHQYQDFDEDVGYVEDVDHIVYEKDEEGRIYGDLIEEDEDYDNIFSIEDLPVEGRRDRYVE